MRILSVPPPTIVIIIIVLVVVMMVVMMAVVIDSSGEILSAEMVSKAKSPGRALLARACATQRPPGRPWTAQAHAVWARSPLPLKGFVATIGPGQISPKPKEESVIDQQLMDYFKFDLSDLHANEQGQFTDKQRARLIQEDKSNRTWSLVGGSGLMLIALIGLGGAILAVTQDSDLGFRIGFGLGFGCVWPLIWGGIGFVVIRNALSKHDIKLARVQGQVNIVSRESYNSQSHTTSTYHELHIGGQDFDVDEDLADVMMQGDEYILYYVDGSSEILSAELVSKAR